MNGAIHCGSAAAEIVRQAAEQLRERLMAIEAALLQSPPGDWAYGRVSQALDACVAALQTTNLWGLQNRLPSSELWNLVGETLCRGWLQNQARIKPRGYAGDYEMLARIYENHLCDDPLGRLFDRYFQDQAAPHAVRNRMQMMAQWIVEQTRASRRTLRVAIVGSAFGLEVRDALRLLDPSQRQRLVVTLLDMDPAALAFARDQIQPLLAPERLVTAATNVFRLVERPRLAQPLLGTDLLFCPGLFDYLDDAQSAAMLAVFWQCLAKGGRMTVFQFATNNPTRAYMEWLGNWYLIYRDEQQLRSLAEAAGIPPACASLGAEPLGVDLFVTAVKA